MVFENKKHQEFYNKMINMLSKYQKVNVYEKCLVYTLGLCETTRKHFKEIYSIKDGIYIDSLQARWQTGTSVKVTRMAFNLYNDSIIYESEDDIDKKVISTKYCPSELFSCSYAPYFFEAIKLKYPEYFREKTKEMYVAAYMRVNSLEQLAPIKSEKITDESDKSIAGLYIRVASDDEESKNNFESQRDLLEKYCKDNNIKNTIQYCDIGKSGNNFDRQAFDEMMKDLWEGKIQKVIVTDISRIHRNLGVLIELLEETPLKNAEIITLDGSLRNIENAKEKLKAKIIRTINEKQVECEEDEETI